ECRSYLPSVFVRYEILSHGMSKGRLEIEAVEVGLKGFDVVRNPIPGFLGALQDGADICDDLLEFWRRKGGGSKVLHDAPLKPCGRRRQPSGLPQSRVQAATQGPITISKRDRGVNHRAGSRPFGEMSSDGAGRTIHCLSTFRPQKGPKCANAMPSKSASLWNPCVLAFPWKANRFPA